MHRGSHDTAAMVVEATVAFPQYRCPHHYPPQNADALVKAEVVVVVVAAVRSSSGRRRRLSYGLRLISSHTASERVA